MTVPVRSGFGTLVAQREKESDRTTRYPRDHVCHMRGGMLVKNGGPFLVKTDERAVPAPDGAVVQAQVGKLM